MPPQQDDPRDRQIEALRRYVAELGRPRERSADEPGAPPPPPQRPPATVPWLVLTVLLVAIALAGGILIGQARDKARQSDTAEGVTGSTLGGLVSTPECKTAVDRANTSLAIAVKVQSVLKDYTHIMNQLESGRITSAEAVRLGTPSEVVASIQTAKFDAALNDYKQVVDKCSSRQP